MITLDNLSSDFAETVLYTVGDETVRRHDAVLRPRIAETLRAFTDGAIRKLLAAGSILLPTDRTGLRDEEHELRLVVVSQFVGACETVLAAAHLLRGGYPHDVSTLARRAFDTAAIGFYYFDNPAAWFEAKRLWAELKASGSANAPVLPPGPSIGSVLQSVISRAAESYGPASERASNEVALKRANQILAQEAHSGPGVRLMSNFVDESTARLGPRDASKDESEFKRAFSALQLAVHAVGLVVGMTFDKVLGLP